MKKYYKSITPNAVNYAMNNSEDLTGLTLSFGHGWVNISDMFSHVANSGHGGYEVISEEEFNEAFDKAIAMISRNVLVAA